MTIDLESGQNESLDYGGASNGRRRSEGSGVSGELHVLEQHGTEVVGSGGVDGPIGALLAEEVKVGLNGTSNLDERPSESEAVMLGATWGGTHCSDDVDLSLDRLVGVHNPEESQRLPGLREAPDDIDIAEVVTVTCGGVRGVLEVVVGVEGEDPLVELVHLAEKESRRKLIVIKDRLEKLLNLKSMRINIFEP